MDLTDKQWALIEPALQLPPKTTRRGRPRADQRAVLNGILWILKTGARWQDLPDRYPSYQTCHRYHPIWKSAANTICTLYRNASWMRLSSPPKGGDADIVDIGPTKRGKGTKITDV